jgi:hypothetical protein
MVLLLLAVLMKGNGSGSRSEAPFFFSLQRSWLLPFLQWCCSGMGEVGGIKTTIPGSRGGAQIIY